MEVKCLTDTMTLRRRIEEAGLKYKYIANQLGLKPYGLQLKINNVFEFKVSEVNLLTKILNLSAGEKEEIFFASNVEK